MRKYIALASHLWSFFERLFDGWVRAYHLGKCPIEELHLFTACLQKNKAHDGKCQQQAIEQPIHCCGQMTK